jgi:hypothetical protein
MQNENAPEIVSAREDACKFTQKRHIHHKNDWLSEHLLS